MKKERVKFNVGAVIIIVGIIMLLGSIGGFEFGSYGIISCLVRIGIGCIVSYTGYRVINTINF